MCKVIIIAPQKGGVGYGKITTTSSLGIGLTKQGKKVLVIDADTQGSLTASLGFTEPDKLEVTLANVLEKVINDEEMEAGYGILKYEEGIDLMLGNMELSGLEVSLVNVMSREILLRSYVDRVKDGYDYILIDCMRSLGMITINAFACADSIFIPFRRQYLPVKGLEQLIKTIGLSPLNVLLNMDEKGDDALGMDDAPEEAISERPEMEEKAANISIPYPVENTRHNYTVENGNSQRLNLWRQWRISLCRELL